jgi:hypothetical protein
LRRVGALNEGKALRPLIFIAAVAGVVPVITVAVASEDARPGAIRDIEINVTRAAPQTETGSIDRGPEGDAAAGYMRVGQGLDQNLKPDSDVKDAVRDEVRSEPEPVALPVSNEKKPDAKPVINKPTKSPAKKRAVRAVPKVKPKVREVEADSPSRIIGNTLDATGTSITSVGRSKDAELFGE